MHIRQYFSGHTSRFVNKPVSLVAPRLAAEYRDVRQNDDQSTDHVVAHADSSNALKAAIYMSVLFFAAALFSVNAAHADEDSVHGIYFGAQGGVVDYFADGDVCDELLEEIEESAIDDSDDDVSSTVAQILNGADCSADSGDTGFGIFAGYRFNRNFAIEVSYLDLGAVTAELMNSTRVEGARLDAEGEARLDAKGLMASALISIPLGQRFSIFGRLGVLAWDADLSANASGSIRLGNRRISFDGLNESRSRSGTDGAYGGGVRFAFNENMAVRAEFTRFEVIDVNSGWIGLEVSLR